MVTFSCDACNDSIKKPKANQHAQRCRASLTCIDCSKTFYDGQWSTHNSCITEAEAYQGHLYKPSKKELKRKAAEMLETPKPVPEAPSKIQQKTIPAPVQQSKKVKKNKNVAPASAQDYAVLQKLGDSASMTLQDAIKQLKGYGKLDKIREKALMKAMMKHIQVDITDGTIRMRIINQ